MENRIFIAATLLSLMACVIAPIVHAAPPLPGKLDPGIIRGMDQGNLKPAPPPGYIEGIIIKPKTFIADGAHSIYVYATGIGVCDDLQLVYGGGPQSKTKKNYDLNAHTEYFQGMPSNPGTYTIEVRPGPMAKRCKGIASDTLVVKKPTRIKTIPRNLFH